MVDVASIIQKPVDIVLTLIGRYHGVELLEELASHNKQLTAFVYMTGGHRNSQNIAGKNLINSNNLHGDNTRGACLKGVK